MQECHEIIVKESEIQSDKREAGIDFPRLGSSVGRAPDIYQEAWVQLPVWPYSLGCNTMFLSGNLGLVPECPVNR
jgi:hypothetical protein